MMAIGKQPVVILLWTAGVLGLGAAVVECRGQDLNVPLEQSPAPASPPYVNDSRMVHLEAELGTLKQQLQQRPAPPAAAQPSPLDCSSPGWYAGYAFSFVKPFFADSHAAALYRQASSTTEVVEFRDYDYDFELTPKVWLGYVGDNGFGVRGRYWLYDHDGDPFQYTSDGNHGAVADFSIPYFSAQLGANDANETLQIRSALRAYEVDLEMTQLVHFQTTSLQLGAGFRGAGLRSHLEAHASLQGTDVNAAGVLQEFEGIGPSLSAELRRPLAEGGLALVAATRGSVLFGQSEQRLDAINYSPLVRRITLLPDSDRVVGCGEAEIGLEWSHALASGGRWYLRGTYEGQLWLGGGSLESNQGNLGFQGFSFALGLDR